MHAIALALLLLAPATRAPDPGQLGAPVRSDRQGLLQVDPIYFRLAAETGGDFYFWQPGEFVQARLQVPLPGETVALSYGTLDARPRRIPIPVESGVTRLTVFAGAQRKDVAVLLRPDGSAFAGHGAGESLQSFTNMAIATVQQPAPGVWQLELRGAGLYSISAQLSPARDESAPMFDRLQFVELGGRPGHEGWFPLGREIRPGETVECSAELDGRVSDVAFKFVSGDGQVLADASLRLEDDSETNYFGRCLVPRVPFRVRVSGRDAQGQPFQRIEAGLRTPR